MFAYSKLEFRTGNSMTLKLEENYGKAGEFIPLWSCIY